MSDYPKHDKVVQSALADLGVHEQPMGSNTGPRILTYQHATWLAGTGWPWCIAFLQYQWKQAGLTIPYLGAGAYALFDWAQKNGWAVTAEHAIPGDAVIFNIGAGHGAILKQTVTGHTVLTVDGNVGDKVCLNERPLSMVRGFVHIPESPVGPLPKAKAPVFEVVTAASGHTKVIFTGRRGSIAKWLAHTPIGARKGGITIRRHRK